MIYKTLHRKLKIKQHKPPLKTENKQIIDNPRFARELIFAGKCQWRIEAEQFHSDYLLGIQQTSKSRLPILAGYDPPILGALRQYELAWKGSNGQVD
jgi:hypothetical protein